MPILYIVADGLYWALRYVARYREKVILKNLRQSFPEKDEAEIRRIKNRFYRNLADVSMETVKALTLSEAEFKRRVSCPTNHILADHLQEGRSVLAMTVHQCNWEWIMLMARLLNPDHQMSALYKPLSDKGFDRLIRDVRSRFGTPPIAVGKAFAEIRARRSEVWTFGIVADQSPLRSEAQHWTTFLGQETSFFTGTHTMARLLQYPVVFVSMRRIKRGKYEMFFEELALPPHDKSPAALIEAYAQKVERVIGEQPEGWLWSHDRWKRPRLPERSATSDTPAGRAPDTARN